MNAKKYILVVDDSRQNRMILDRILKAAGYETLEAENGQVALDLLSSRRHDVALMLLDISMPVMDGYAVLHRMNESGWIAQVPVIVTTGSDDAATEIRCLEAGASDFLRKPYNAEMVRHRVQSLLRLWDNAALINRLEIDRVTGVYSKEFFYRHAEACLNEHPDTPYWMIYTGIDDFKMVNVHYGNAAGDDFLRYLGGTLQEACAAHDGVCGRLDGDSFAYLTSAPPPATQEEGGAVCEALLKDAPIAGVQVKFGIYAITDRSVDTAQMCDRAKLALAGVKHHYGKYFAFYDDAIQKKAMREHQIAGTMVEALAEHQFVVYLQPKHSVESKTVAGAEALVRWIHPTMGFISPGDFIPLFERNGFIVKLDYYMWESVCQLLRRWLDNGMDTVPISVNASRADFATPALAAKIEALVDSYRIPHNLIHFEVTESAYTDQPQQIISAVSDLRSCGFLIEMDDFGSGYSSLNMLSELPIDILKLDMRFMQNQREGTQGNKRNVLSYIVSLSKWLQLPTVAEGVEEKEEFDLLQSMGCNYIQGYYFAKPMPVPEFEGYLAKCNHTAALPATPVIEQLLNNDSSAAQRPLVLVVEDVESNRQMLRALLEPHYRVVSVENGQVACEYMQAHRGDVDCMLLDLLMPVMDGFQVMEVMRADGLIDEVPVIITTEAGPDNELRALHMGATDFLAKPYNAELLLFHVNKVTEEKSFYRLRREFKRESRILYEKAYQDDLTGLLNRHGLKKAMAEREDGCYALMALDIDGLKLCNDRHGREAGDKLVQSVAGMLRRTVRAGDILARTGGDEFVVVLQQIDNSATALEQGRRLCKALQTESTQADPHSCSAGITTAEDAEDFSFAMHRADVALYHAKHECRGDCCLWQDGMRIT